MRRAATDVVWNLSGLGLPLIAAVLCIPELVRGLGDAAFGMLSAMWVLVGYFSILDLGIGGALTQALAARLATDRESTRQLYWSGMLLLLVVGGVAASVLAASSGIVSRELFGLSGEFADQVRAYFLLMALSLPCLTVGSGIRGMLEAQQRFDLVNIVRAPIGIWTFVGPWIAVTSGFGLFGCCVALVCGRYVGLAAYLLCARSAFPEVSRLCPPSRSEMRLLLSSGSWFMASNLVGPILIYLDRMLIGVTLGPVFLARYAVAHEFITKFLWFPSALAAVLFPRFARASVQRLGDANDQYVNSMRAITALLTPALILTIVAAPWFIGLWLNTEYAEQTGPVLQVLAVGILANALAQIPFALVQGAGHAAFAAKLHVLELLVYVPLLYACTLWGGLIGCAVAASIRTIDFVALSFFARRLGIAGAVRCTGWALLQMALLGAVIASGNAFQLSITIAVSLAVCSLLGWRAIRSALIVGRLAGSD